MSRTHWIVAAACAVAACGGEPPPAVPPLPVTVAQRTDPAPLNDAPYRDGLFQGQLATQRGSPNRPSLGRWTNTEDQAHFALGYEQAFVERLHNFEEQR